MRLFRGQPMPRLSAAVPCRALDYRSTTTHPHYKGALSFIYLPHPHVSHAYQLFISKITEVVDKSTDVRLNLFGDNET